MSRIFWFRRDLRLNDNVALNAAIAGAIEDGDRKVVPSYFVDLDAFESLSAIRQHSLIASLDSLGASLNRKLTIRHGRTLNGIAAEVVAVAKAAQARTVHATRAFDPAAIAEQNAVGLALKQNGIFLQLDDSNYAVAPGVVNKPDGTSYRVYTPFYKGWLNHSNVAPVELLDLGEDWFEPIECVGRPVASAPAPFEIKAGEGFALRTLKRFEKRALLQYDELRNRADIAGTSHLSHALSHGEIHPRTILARLGENAGEIVFAKEICWREFYADVLFRNPQSLTDYYEPRFADMRYDRGEAAEKKLQAWKRGLTGFPMVDAGMRQLAADGWMHNRVRMIVASFLVKDLHLEWQQGAEHFEELLSDFDPASNAHGWQWTAGSGTDASPYYRVFNPITQGYKFDPNGDYVRKYIPELRHIDGAEVHEPWNLLNGYQHDYPTPIVDHAVEREEALARLAEIKKPQEN
jgi:deoxyribodipyrimidine photo-lyase